MTTIPKNKILDFLYSTDRHVSLEKLGNWIENNTDGKYKIVNTDTQLTIHADTRLAQKFA
jgi:hypothetical protein